MLASGSHCVVGIPLGFVSDLAVLLTCTSRGFSAPSVVLPTLLCYPNGAGSAFLSHLLPLPPALVGTCRGGAWRGDGQPPSPAPGLGELSSWACEGQAPR